MPIASEPKQAAMQVVISNWTKAFGTGMAGASTCGLTKMT